MPHSEGAKPPFRQERFSGLRPHCSISGQQWQRTNGQDGRPLHSGTGRCAWWPGRLLPLRCCHRLAGGQRRQEGDCSRSTPTASRSLTAVTQRWSWTASSESPTRVGIR